MHVIEDAFFVNWLSDVIGGMNNRKSNSTSKLWTSAFELWWCNYQESYMYIHSWCCCCCALFVVVVVVVLVLLAGLKYAPFERRINICCMLHFNKVIASMCSCSFSSNSTCLLYLVSSYIHHHRHRLFTMCRRIMHSLPINATENLISMLLWLMPSYSKRSQEM